MPSFKEEEKLQKQGYKFIAGIDEAGRGPLAGPVVAAAVIVKKNKGKKGIDFLLKKVKDSKKLSFLQREEIFEELIRCKMIIWSVASVAEKIIDKINIKNAAELAMEKAVNKLRKKPDFLLIDGNSLKNQKLKKTEYKLVVRGDDKIFSCAAASIIAKVVRDRIMQKFHKKYPKFGFDKHKGYPTKFHYKALRENGPCPIHRRSFKLTF